MLKLRVNQWIKIPTVRVIDENGQQLGVLPTEEAQRIAIERGLDLVEVSPNTTPPVCRIMDYGKYQYAESKKLHQAKKHRMHNKEIRLRPLTEKHDIQIKLKHLRELLEKGDRVTITMVFRGREKNHKEIGYNLMQQIIDEITPTAKVETPLTRQGGRLFVVVVPKK